MLKRQKKVKKNCSCRCTCSKRKLSPGERALRELIAKTLPCDPGSWATQHGNKADYNGYYSN